MADPLPAQSQKGTIKEFTLWMALLLSFGAWGASLCSVVRGVSEWYYPTTDIPMTAADIRWRLLYWWPVLLISTLALFALGLGICRGARRTPEVLQFRSRRWVLYILILFLGVFAAERMMSLVRTLIEPICFEGRLILSLFGLVWSAGSAYGFYLWLQGYWEDHPKAQRWTMAFTGLIIVAVLIVGVITLRKVSGPDPHPLSIQESVLKYFG